MPASITGHAAIACVITRTASFCGGKTNRDRASSGEH
jgi:hypothetical protein